MLALLVTGKSNQFIFVKGKKVRRDFGPGILEAGIMFKKNDIIYCHKISWEKFEKTLGWDLIEEDDSYIINEGTCWMFKQSKSLLGSIIVQVFENIEIVKNLF